MMKKDYVKRFVAVLCLSLMLLGMLSACKGEEAAKTAATAAGGASGAGSSASSQAQSSAKLDGEIVIGACSDISGSGASNGQGEAKAYQMIADEINEAGGVLGKKLVIRQEDTNGTTEGSVNAINRQFSDPRVVAVLGFMYSSQVMGISDIVLQAKKPVMFGGSSPTITKLKNPYLFRMRLADDLAVELALDYMIKNFKPKKIGMLYCMNDIGTQGYTMAEAYCKKVGQDMIADGFAAGVNDCYSNILKLKDAGCDAMLCWANEEELAIITRQRIELGYDKIPMMGNSGIGNLQYKNVLNAQQMEGIYGLAESADEGNDWPYYTDFLKKFTEKTGLQINNNICGLAPAIYVLVDAMKRCGTTESEALCKAIRETKDFSSISGKLTCDSIQNLNHNAIIYKMTGGVRKFAELHSADAQ